MATTITHIVDPSNQAGTNYTSLTAWEAAQQRNLVTADEIAKADCRTSSATADSSAFVIAGWANVSNTQYVWINAMADHNGVWDTSVYFLELSNSSNIFQVGPEFTRVFGIQGNNTHDTGRVFISASTTEPVYFDKCIAKTTSSAKNGKGYAFSGSQVQPRIKNCLAYDFSGTTSGTGFQIASPTIGPDKAYLYHNTAVDCWIGFESLAGASIVGKNNLAQGCADGFLATSAWEGSTDYNCSDVASDAPGGNSVTGSVTFENEGADIFRLGSSDTTALDAGVNLSGDANLPVADSVEGVVRPEGSTSDIGYSEFASASTDATAQVNAKLVVKSTASTQVDGKAVVKSTASAQLDGKAVVKSSASTQLDGKAVVKDTASIQVDGKLVVKDTASTQIDGKAVVKSTASAQVDGKARVILTVSTQLDGKAVVKDTASTQVDGKAVVKSTASTQLDGKAVVQAATAVSTQLDGKAVIKDTASTQLDGKAVVKSTASTQLDGKAVVKSTASTQLDGKAIVKSTASAQIDGKAVIIGGTAVSTQIDGKAVVKSTASAQIDGKAVVKSTASAQIDGKIIVGIPWTVVPQTTVTYVGVPDDPNLMIDGDNSTCGKLLAPVEGTVTGIKLTNWSADNDPTQRTTDTLVIRGQFSEGATAPDYVNIFYRATVNDTYALVNQYVVPAGWPTGSATEVRIDLLPFSGTDPAPASEIYISFSNAPMGAGDDDPPLPGF